MPLTHRQALAKIARGGHVGCVCGGCMDPHEPTFTITRVGQESHVEECPNLIAADALGWRIKTHAPVLREDEERV